MWVDFDGLSGLTVLVGLVSMCELGDLSGLSWSQRFVWSGGC